MVKPMKYRELVKLLRDAGFSSEQGKGDHEKWSAPDCRGRHHHADAGGIAGAYA